MPAETLEDQHGRKGRITVPTLLTTWPPWELEGCWTWECTRQSSRRQVFNLSWVLNPFENLINIWTLLPPKNNTYNYILSNSGVQFEDPVRKPWYRGNDKNATQNVWAFQSMSAPIKKLSPHGTIEMIGYEHSHAHEDICQLSILLVHWPPSPTPPLAAPSPQLVTISASLLPSPHPPTSCPRSEKHFWIFSLNWILAKWLNMITCFWNESQC